MGIFGIVLDDGDFDTPSPKEPRPKKKKANFMKRFQKHCNDDWEFIRRETEYEEYEKRLKERVNFVTLPLVTETLVGGSDVASLLGPGSPTRQTQLISSPTSPPKMRSNEVVTGVQNVPTETCESPEVEMYMSAGKDKSGVAAVESEGPLVIPSSPVAEAMEESMTPDRSKRYRTPLPRQAPMQSNRFHSPNDMEAQPTSPARQSLVQVPDQGAVYRGRAGREGRVRRYDEIERPENTLAHNTLQMAPGFLAPRLSGASFASSHPSFADPSTGGSQFTPRTSFGSQSQNSSFHGRQSNPYPPHPGVDLQAAGSNQFPTPSSFSGNNPSQSAQTGSHPSTPGFQQSPMEAPAVAFNVGRVSTPVRRRGQHGRRRNRN